MSRKRKEHSWWERYWRNRIHRDDICKESVDMWHWINSTNHQQRTRPHQSKTHWEESDHRWRKDINCKKVGDVIIKMNDISVKLKDFLYVPGFDKRITSICRLLSYGWIIKGDKESYVVLCKNYRIIFKKDNENHLTYLKNIETIKKIDEVNHIKKKQWI